MTSTSRRDLDVQVLTPPATPAVLVAPVSTFEGTPQIACDELSKTVAVEEDIVVDWEVLLGGCMDETGPAQLDAVELGASLLLHLSKRGVAADHALPPA